MIVNEQDLTRLAAELGRQLLSAKAQVSTAESCTGGGIAEAITRIPGSSAWFEAGYVTYSNAVAVSGVAGPDGGSPEKPVGTVWLAWGDGEQLFSERCLFPGDRTEVRRQTVEAALAGLLRLIAQENPNAG